MGRFREAGRAERPGRCCLGDGPDCVPEGGGWPGIPRASGGGERNRARPSRAKAMAGHQKGKVMLDEVRHNQILRELYLKELRTQKLYTEYHVNPLRKGEGCRGVEEGERGGRWEEAGSTGCGGRGGGAARCRSGGGGVGAEHRGRGLPCPAPPTPPPRLDFRSWDFWLGRGVGCLLPHHIRYIRYV